MTRELSGRCALTLTLSRGERELALDVFHALELGPAGVHQLHQSADVPAGSHYCEIEHRFLNVGILVGRGQLGRTVDLDDLTTGQSHLVGHTGGSDDQVKIVFPLQPLLNDLQVHQPQETTPEAKSQRRAVLRLNGQRRIIQLQLLQGGSRRLPYCSPSEGYSPANTMDFRGTYPGRGFGGRRTVYGQRVADGTFPARP